MLVRVQPGTGPAAEGLSSAEAHVVRLARSWTGQYALPGLLMVNVNVPAERGATRQVDGVLWSPHGLVVIEVKGFTRPQPGTLTIPLNGPWTVDGQPAALHTLADTNPAEQARSALYAVKNALTHASVDPGFVSGLIVVIPQDGRLTIGNTRNLGTGMSVALGTNSAIRKVLHELGRRPAVWAADDVLDACRTLDLERFAPHRGQLLGDGFPDLITLTPRPRHHTPKRSRSTPEPPPRQPSSPWNSTRIREGMTNTGRPMSAPPRPPGADQAMPPPPQFRYQPGGYPVRPARPRRRTGAIAAFVTLMLVTIVGVSSVLAIYIAFHG